MASRNVESAMTNYKTQSATTNPPSQGASAPQIASGSRQLLAYRLNKHAPAPVPAEGTRTWMDATPARAAYRCLPLTMANQAGWHCLNTHAVEVVWNGSDGASGLTIRFLDETPETPYVLSSFGSGVVTWHIPFLFVTPSGFNLLARGPANMPKDGVQALEGLVETDWSPASFTMNWKLTRPNHPVRFERDEPICLIVPQPRNALEGFEPFVLPLSENPDLESRHSEWAKRRVKFFAEVQARFAEDPAGTAANPPWQKEYMRGTIPNDAPRFAHHQTSLKLGKFRDVTTIPEPHAQ